MINIKVKNQSLWRKIIGLKLKANLGLVKESASRICHSEYLVQPELVVEIRSLGSLVGVIVFSQLY